MGGWGAAIADQLLTLLTNGIAANGGTHNGAIPLNNINDGGSSVLNDFLNSQTYDATRPKAFLNWIIVDEEFKKVTSSLHMGAVQVPAISGSMQYQTLVGLNQLTVRRNGWLYVYVSNESNQDVYFDDLTINDKRGPVVEMNNYYAFGLEIPGLNSKAIGFGNSPLNRLKYNSKELQNKEFLDGSGLEDYDYGARMYDPQIGRFMTVDPLAANNRRYSPYVYGNDNSIRFIDPDGMSSNDVNDGDQMVNFIDVKDKNGNVTHVIYGDAEKGAKEEYVGGFNGGAGAPFRSGDEAAVAWSLENIQYTKLGQKEHGATIYSQKQGDRKSFSYNGSYAGSLSSVDYHDNEKPQGAEVEGYIHTHSNLEGFSTRHNSGVESNGKPVDADYITNDPQLYKDFYLVNPSGNLTVSRGALPILSGGDPVRGEEMPLIERMGSKTQVVKTGNFLDANRQPLTRMPSYLLEYKRKH